MLSRDEFERYLDRLSETGGSITEVEPGLWRIHPGGALDFDVAASYAPPVVLLRAKVMDLPADATQQGALTRRLLELNAADLLHGAYGIDGDSVVLTDALELAHLDYEELRASYESMTLALVGHMRELARATGEFAVPNGAPNGPPNAAPNPAPNAAPHAAPAEAR